MRRNLSLRRDARCVALGLLLLLGASAYGRTGPELRSEPWDEKRWGRLELALSEGEGWDGTSELVFALYSSGRVLYKQPGDFTYRRYFAVQLSRSERNALLDGLPLDRVGHMRPPDRRGDDGETECIHVWGKLGHKQDCIWGGIERDDQYAKHIPNYQRTPAGMIQIWKRLAHYASTKATPWPAPRVSAEVNQWESEANCGSPAPVAWPSTWPVPTPKTAAHDPRVVGELTLPGSQLPILEQHLASRTPRGCVQPFMRDGGLYWIGYRLQFPTGAPWMEHPAY